MRCFDASPHFFGMPQITIATKILTKIIMLNCRFISHIAALRNKRNVLHLQSSTVLFFFSSSLL